jgi:hypothetical protein
MTPQEIKDYNERCAKFLGYKNTTPTDKDFNIYEKEGSPLIEVMSMKFHTDWNWIMEVVEAIEKMGANFKIKTLWNKFNKCSITQVTVLIEEGTVNESKYLSTISDSTTLYRRSSSTSTSKKEQVIEAINQFLIWHEQQ